MINYLFLLKTSILRKFTLHSPDTMQIFLTQIPCTQTPSKCSHTLKYLFVFQGSLPHPPPISFCFLSLLLTSSSFHLFFSFEPCVSDSKSSGLWGCHSPFPLCPLKACLAHQEVGLPLALEVSRLLQVSVTSHSIFYQSRKWLQGASTVCASTYFQSSSRTEAGKGERSLCQY